MTSPSVVPWFASELRRVGEALGAVAGRPISDSDMDRSIRAYETVRGLLRDLYALRTAAPERISTAELYTLARLVTLMDPVDSGPVLADAIEGSKLRLERPKDRIRVVLVGSFCEQPPLELIESLESAGCYIVEDDFLQGWRWARRAVTGGGDPYVALARAYVEDSVHLSTKHDLRRPRAQALIEAARSSRADAVIFLPDHKDVVLFPERVGGKYRALTRPMPQSSEFVATIRSLRSTTVMLSRPRNPPSKTLLPCVSTLLTHQAKLMRSL